MDTTREDTLSPINALGHRLRQVRIQRGLSQTALAQPEFTKSYVSPVERGKARPSLKALELLARRLGVPASDFLALPATPAHAPDPVAWEEDLAYQLDCARRAIDTGQAGDAIQLINAIEQEYRAALSQLGVETRYRIHYLRAAAYLRLLEPGSAQQDLSLAQVLAEQLADGGETVERVRNAIGAAYYQQDHPQLARQQHERCMQAVHSGIVKDPNLRLLIYSNLANDYWALDEVEQAISVYKEALLLLDGVSNLERQSGIYWGLSLAYKTVGDLSRAKLYASRALEIYEAAHNLTAAAQLHVNLAEISTQRGEYPEAEQFLQRAVTVLETS